MSDGNFQNCPGPLPAPGKRRFLKMTPMIDVIFLLLTFFVLTANFRVPEDYLPIKIAQDGRGGIPSIIEPLSISIEAAKGGVDIKIGSAETLNVRESALDEGLAGFANSLKTTMESSFRKPGDPVEIECGQEVSWDHLVKIYSILSAFGADNITFNMQSD